MLPRRYVFGSCIALLSLTVGAQGAPERPVLETLLVSLRQRAMQLESAHISAAGVAYVLSTPDEGPVLVRPDFVRSLIYRVIQDEISTSTVTLVSPGTPYQSREWEFAHSSFEYWDVSLIRQNGAGVFELSNQRRIPQPESMHYPLMVAGLAHTDGGSLGDMLADGVLPEVELETIDNVPCAVLTSLRARLWLALDLNYAPVQLISTEAMAPEHDVIRRRFVRRWLDYRNVGGVYLPSRYHFENFDYYENDDAAGPGRRSMVMLYHMPICFVNSLEAESWLNWSVPPVPGGVLQDATGPGFREVRTYGIDADALAAQVVRGEQPFGFNLPYLQLGYMPQTPPPLEAPE